MELFVPVVVVYSTVFYRLIAKRFTTADEAEGELSAVVQENATGVRVVRAFGREQFEMERFDKKNNAFAKLWIRLGTLSGLYWGIGDLITGLQVIAVDVYKRQGAAWSTKMLSQPETGKWNCLTGWRGLVWLRSMRVRHICF